jgi:hypothetical protein
MTTRAYETCTMLAPTENTCCGFYVGVVEPSK